MMQQATGGDAPHAATAHAAIACAATPCAATVIGGGPAGLMAAEVLAAAGVAVTVYERMPSVGRKLLMAGRGGLNLTHSEPLSTFLPRYGQAAGRLAPFIQTFPPSALIDWCHGLEQATFVGSSGRVFPTAMKASRLLRAWLNRLDSLGVRIRLRQRWTGWTKEGIPVFGDAPPEPGPPAPAPPAPAPPTQAPPTQAPPKPAQHVTILALGGASWPRLGSDGGWTALLPGQVTRFSPSNCGFRVAWSELFRQRCAGRPLKRLALSCAGQTARGEAVITESGLEGGAVYALSASLRDAIAAQGSARLTVDLRPDLTREQLAQRLDRRGSLSTSNALRRLGGLSPEAAALVQEALHQGAPAADLAGLIKAVPVTLLAPMPIERAISSAGGLRWDALDDSLMLRGRPGVFAAGEMLDWEAPTGGYLLQACFSTGHAAGHGALAWLQSRG